MARRKRYSAEFKREALNRANEEGVTDVLVAEEFEINARQLRRWLEASSTRLAVIIHVVALKDKVNPVQVTMILDGMISFVVHFIHFTGRQVPYLIPNVKYRS